MKYEITVKGIGFWSKHRSLKSAEKELVKAKKRFGIATLWEEDKKIRD